MSSATLFIPLVIYTLITLSTATQNIREYHFETTAKTWAEANTVCEDKYHTSLATIITKDDLNAAIFTIPIIIGNTITHAWIGLNDLDVEGKWEWADSTTCKFDNATGGHACSDHWYIDEPNDYKNGEDCGEVWSHMNEWTFNDESCDDAQSFLCNKDFEYTYVYNGSFFNWTEAETNCNKYHAGLATIQDTNDLMNAINLIPPGVTQVWIGLNDRKEEGVWSWSNGDGCIIKDAQNLTHDCSAFWRSNEPNNYGTGEDCGQLRYWSETRTWLFNDQNCDDVMASLCIEANTAHPTPQPTPDITTAHFALSLTQRTWAEGLVYCEENYYGLASLLSEQDLQEAILLFPNNADVMAIHDAWVGLNDLKQEGMWQWVDGSECVINNGNCTDLWDNGEPNNKHEMGENCGQLKWIWKIDAWKINDKMCDYTYPVLCGRNESTMQPTSDPTPSPSTKLPTNKPTLRPTTPPTDKPSPTPYHLVNVTVHGKDSSSSSGISALDIALILIIILLVIGLGSTLFCLLRFKKMYKSIDEMSQYVGHQKAGVKTDDHDVRLVDDDEEMATTIN